MHFGGQDVGMHDCLFDVNQILLAKIHNAQMIIMREHVTSENGIRDLRGMNQVHFGGMCLQVALLRLVIFESIRKEPCSWLDHVLGYEDNDNL